MKKARRRIDVNLEELDRVLDLSLIHIWVRDAI